MTPTITHRRRPAAARAAVLGVCVAAAFTLAGCSGSDGGAGASGATTPGRVATDTAPGGTGTTGGSGATGTSGGATASAKPAAKTSAVTTPPAAAAKPAASTASGTGGGCDHKMPISPDELAVYRYTTEGGALNLIVKLGNWGCAPADSDGAPFVTVGKEIPMPLDQAAYVTATNPVVESSENQRIGVQEFLDWLDAHPDSGLVFKYHVGGGGAIDRLEEVFTP